MCLAIPGRVESIDERSPLERMAIVKFGTVLREVNVAFVPEAEPGDYVLVHVGVAISRIDEEEAKTVFEYLEQIGEAGDIGEAPP
ncbi:MAG: HypC/HybG/HupF family hydrogenase formation chaperone [Fimbriimonas sp.]|nr:HypC/HybG/HupF family hydrogenase formation chaperone [Fimbriimonas sp.]